MAGATAASKSRLLLCGRGGYSVKPAGGCGCPRFPQYGEDNELIPSHSVCVFFCVNFNVLIQYGVILSTWYSRYSNLHLSFCTYPSDGVQRSRKFPGLWDNTHHPRLYVVCFSFFLVLRHVPCRFQSDMNRISSINSIISQ